MIRNYKISNKYDIVLIDDIDSANRLYISENAELHGKITWENKLGIFNNKIAHSIKTETKGRNKYEQFSFCAQNVHIAAYNEATYVMKNSEVKAFAFGIFSHYIDGNYKTKMSKKDEKGKVYFYVEDKDFNTEKIISDELILAKHYHHYMALTREPANFLNPESYASYIESFSDKIDVEILDQEELHKMGFGLLNSVGQGSKYNSKVAILKLNVQPETKNPMVLVGKGVTFDTGGLNIKPNLSMMNMHSDMQGSALVLNTLLYLKDVNYDGPVVGLLGIVENAVSRDSFKMNDVFYSYGGKSVEIAHTDAEGRLVLADLLEYAQEQWPELKLLMNFCTLTGALAFALGDSMPAIISYSLKLADDFAAISTYNSERTWVLPIPSVYLEKRGATSSIADIANSMGNKGSNAGTINGAIFLSFFLKNEIKERWLHFDIANYEESHYSKYNERHTQLLRSLTSFIIEYNNEV